MQEDWFTTKQIAERLNVTERTVRRFIEAGDLTAIELGKRAGYRISASDFQAFIESKKTGDRTKGEEGGNS